MALQQIPVVVLAGFLGSGKTTLLNHLLGAGDGTRIGAVVNDFGSIEIDAMTVAGQVDSMVSLGNGCLCCAVDTSELDTYLERLARPAARIDVIVIEASGLAEPQELIRMILASDNDRIVYGGLIEVVDAAEFDATRARHPELDRHVGIADIVVLNKTDRLDGAALQTLRDTLADLAPGRPVICTAYGRVDPELFFDRGAGRTATRPYGSCPSRTCCARPRRTGPRRCPPRSGARAATAPAALRSTQTVRTTRTTRTTRVICTPPTRASSSPRPSRCTRAG